MEDVSTKCFSSRLIKGVGNLSYTVSFSAIRINLQKNKHMATFPIVLEWGRKTSPTCHWIPVSRELSVYLCMNPCSQLLPLNLISMKVYVCVEGGGGGGGAGMIDLCIRSLYK